MGAVMTIAKVEPQRRCCDAPMHEWQDTARGWVAWCETCGRVAWWLGGGNTRQMQPGVPPKLREAIDTARVVALQMSNLCHNYSQAGCEFDDSRRASMKALQVEWDAASAKLHEMLKR